MNARVRSDYRWKNVLAFCGVEFTKSEYRPVPKGYEDQALKHPFLEVEQEVKQEVKKVVEPTVEATEEVLIKSSEAKPKKKAEK
jgi:hypothetical protein